MGAEDDRVPSAAELDAAIGELGIEQEEVALALGVTQPTVSRWLRGGRPLPRARALQIGAMIEARRQEEQWPPPEPHALFPELYRNSVEPERKRLTRRAMAVDEQLGRLLRVVEELSPQQIDDLTHRARVFRKANRASIREGFALAAERGDDPTGAERGPRQARPSPEAGRDDDITGA